MSLRLVTVFSNSESLSVKLSPWAGPLQMLKCEEHCKQVSSYCKQHVTAALLLWVQAYRSPPSCLHIWSFSISRAPLLFLKCGLITQVVLSRENQTGETNFRVQKKLVLSIYMTLPARPQSLPWGTSFLRNHDSELLYMLHNPGKIFWFLYCRASLSTRNLCSLVMSGSVGVKEAGEENREGRTAWRMEMNRLPANYFLRKSFPVGSAPQQMDAK